MGLWIEAQGKQMAGIKMINKEWASERKEGPQHLNWTIKA